MNVTDPPRVEAHNISQRAHFERFERPTMIPVSSPYILRQLQRLIEFAELQPEDRILEVGCGMGRYTLPLAAMGFDISGLDLTPGLLDLFRTYNAGRFDIPLHCFDILDAPESLHGQFDAVIGFFTLHHLHDLYLSFAAMTRLVRPGGCIVFLEPNALNPLYYLQITFTPGMSWKADKGVMRMRPDVVLGAMRAAGLTDLRVKRFGAFPPFITNRSFGSRFEELLERMPFLNPIRPFQLFSGTWGNGAPSSPIRGAESR